jgi:hypothetical protein
MGQKKRTSIDNIRHSVNEVIGSEDGSMRKAGVLLTGDAA